MEERTLKPYRGFFITKSYEKDANGCIDINSLIYIANSKDDGLFDGDKTFKGLKHKIDKYLGCK